MKQDIRQTKVKFRKDATTSEIFAVFPQLKYNKYLYGNDVLTCYAHLGQHSSCNKEWVKGETKPAKESEYLPLKSELEQIGYNLKICK